MRLSPKFLVAGAAAALVATSGSAFTASNTLNGNNVAGYATATSSGTSTSAIEHTLSTDGATIKSTALTFSVDVPTTTLVRAGFDGVLYDCTVTQGATTDPDTAVCTYTTAFATDTATKFTVSAS